MVLAAVAALVTLIIAFSLLVARLPRAKMMKLLATRLGYRYSPDGGQNIPDRLCFAQLFAHRGEWVVSNLMFDRSGDVVVEIFDYDGGSTSAGGHAVSAGVVAVEVAGACFEPFLLRLETAGDRLKAAAGFDDIDFESHEFSKKFFVQSASKRFAYDVITARQMELLLPVNDINIELGESAAIFYIYGRPSVEKLAGLHGIARGFLSNVPASILGHTGDPRTT